MKLHANARTCPKSRRLLIDRLRAGRGREIVAAELGVTVRTVDKWAARYRNEGEAGLLDRSSRPKRSPARTAADRVALILHMRRLRMTGAEIAELLGMPNSTVSAVLKRGGLGKLSRLDPPEPPNRYERRRPGELLHIDVKKLGRIPAGRAGHRVHGNRRLQANTARKDAAGVPRRRVGWEYVHIAIDDCTRLAYAEVLPNEKAQTAIAFLRRARDFYAAHGIHTQRVMTDNGACYRSTAHAICCRALGLKHLRTRPYRPRTNGKAERFIRTMIAGWNDTAIYGSSPERARALDGWIWTYNHRRRHSAIGRQPPIARLNELNNLSGSYS